MGQVTFDTQLALITLLALVLTATLHEFAHALAADRLGDETPRKEGRVSLIPLDQFDLFRGVALILFSVCGFFFAWGKPVQVNAANFKEPRKADMLVTACGPAVNLALALILGIVMRCGYFHLHAASPWHRLIDVAFQVNVITFLFNLVPLPPFDGARFLADTLPEQTEKAYQQFVRQWGWVLLFAVLFFGSVFAVIIANSAQRFFAGTPRHATMRPGVPTRGSAPAPPAPASASAPAPASPPSPALAPSAHPSTVPAPLTSSPPAPAQPAPSAS